MNRFDPIEKSIELAEASENAMFGVARPQLTPQRQRQADDARNTIKRYIRHVRLIQALHEEDVRRVELGLDD